MIAFNTPFAGLPDLIILGVLIVWKLSAKIAFNYPEMQSPPRYHPQETNSPPPCEGVFALEGKTKDGLDPHF